MVDHLVVQTQQVADKVAQTTNLQLLATTSLSTVLFRLNHQGVENLDALNQKVRIEALTRGVAVLGETTIDGQSALKFTILNPCLSMSDFDNLLNQINQLAQELIDTSSLV
jgi:glutamate/tyrosine decarboxylase-like PLP-dependent enzyme